jgi:AbrB family looped-hinge helix DNA binding protein
MGSATVKVDGKGRIIIPKEIRETVNIREGIYLAIRAEEKTIMMEPLEPVADKYFGAFKVTRWPENMDEFLVEVIREWWTTQAT